MLQKKKNNIIFSLLTFVLLTALTHICVLIFLAIKNANVKYLNYFQILGLNELWPNIASNWISDLISTIIMAAIITIIIILTRENLNK